MQEILQEFYMTKVSFLGQALAYQRRMKGDTAGFNRMTDIQSWNFFYTSLDVSLPCARIGLSSKTSSNQSLRQISTLNAAEMPRLLPISGFTKFDPLQVIVEEEESPYFKADRFHSVHLGHLSRPLPSTRIKRDRSHVYVALMVYDHNSLIHRELLFSAISLTKFLTVYIKGVVTFENCWTSSLSVHMASIASLLLK